MSGISRYLGVYCIVCIVCANLTLFIYLNKRGFPHLFFIFTSTCSTVSHSFPVSAGRGGTIGSPLGTPCDPATGGGAGEPSVPRWVPRAIPQQEGVRGNHRFPRSYMHIAAFYSSEVR